MIRPIPATPGDELDTVKSRKNLNMRHAFFCLLCLALTACVTTHSVDLQRAAGDVQVLFEYPKDGRYANLGLIDVDYYRPGFTVPSLTEAMPKVVDQVHAMGGNAVIVRNHYAGQFARSIIVSAEVLRVPK
jgi:hypothetical protein